MDLSPRSTVSSDLYSSEPSKPNEHSPPGPKEPLVNEDLHPPSEIARDGAEESGYSDMMEGLDSPSEQASRSSSAPISNDIPEISHKRKREQDGDAENTMQEGSLSNSQMNRMPFRSRTDSQISMDQLPPHRQSGPSMSDRARIKRSKTNDQTSGSDIAAQLFPSHLRYLLYSGNIFSVMFLQYFLADYYESIMLSIPILLQERPVRIPECCLKV